MVNLPRAPSPQEFILSGKLDVAILALYDGTSDFLVVCGEVKTPRPDIQEMAISTEQNDQVGRYLAQTGVVILCNVRGFGLLAVEQGYRSQGPVPPAHRRLEQVVELWPSASSLRAGRKFDENVIEPLFELVETA